MPVRTGIIREMYRDTSVEQRKAGTGKMLQLKYAIVDGTPVLFGSGMHHRDMLKLGRVESAGFVMIDGNGMGRLSARVYGESLSLKLKPDAERDERLIEIYLNGVAR